METPIAPNELTANFDALVDVARERTETIVAEHDGVVLCRIVPQPKLMAAGEFAE